MTSDTYEVKLERHITESNLLAIDVSLDGSRVVMGGGEKLVIIFTNKLDALNKYSHSSAVNCITINPHNKVIASCSNEEIILYNPEGGDAGLNRLKSPKVMDMHWSPDGQFLACGHFDGELTIRDGAGYQHKQIPSKNNKIPIFCVKFSPKGNAKSDYKLAVATWNRQLVLYDKNFSSLSSVAKSLQHNPTSMNWFSDGQVVAVGFNNGEIQCFNRDGIFLSKIVTQTTSWISAICMRPSKNEICYGDLNGNFNCLSLYQSVVYSIWKDRYAYRDMMTYVVVKYLSYDQVVRINCKDHILDLSIYGDKLGVRFNDRIMVYTLAQNENLELSYKAFCKINMKNPCEGFMVTSNHFLFWNKNVLTCQNYQGLFTRDWNFEASVKLCKLIGGLADHECLVAVLDNGLLYKVVLSNPFPILIIKVELPVKAIDFSLNKDKISILDSNNNLSIYHVVSKQAIETIPMVTSFGFNYEVDDMYAYSSEGNIYTKIKNNKRVEHKVTGDVVIYSGNKIYTIDHVNINQFEIAQTNDLYQFIDKKEFEYAYRIACFGVTETDWNNLGIECIKNNEWELAKSALTKNRNYGLLDLVEKYRSEKNVNVDEVNAEILTLTNMFYEAAQVYEKMGKLDKAIEIFTDLKQWEKAMNYIKKSDGTGSNNPLGANIKKSILNKLYVKQAMWYREIGQFKDAGKIFVQISDFENAIEMFGSHGYIEELIDICRSLNRNDSEKEIRRCSFYFRKVGNYNYAKESLVKLDDFESLIDLHVDFNMWNEAFMMSKKDRFKSKEKQIYLSYAEFLASKDQFEEAREAYLKAERPDLSLALLKNLFDNSLNAENYHNAAKYHYKYIQEQLRSQKISIEQYKAEQEVCDCYYAYSFVDMWINNRHKQFLLGTDFNTLVFHACRFIINSKTKSGRNLHMNYVSVYYALAKLSFEKNCHKTSRQAYETLKNYILDKKLLKQVELGYMKSRSKPYRDDEDLSTVCPRCLSSNSILNPNGNECAACNYPFVQSSLGFECLPLVEFKVDPSLTKAKVQALLGTKQDPSKVEMEDRIDFDEQNMNQTGFMKKVVENCQYQMNTNQYAVVELDSFTLSTLEVENVYCIDRSPITGNKDDLSWYYNTLSKFYKVVYCDDSQRFYKEEEYDFAFLDNKLPYVIKDKI